MAEQAPRRQFRDAVESLLADQAGYARYQRSQFEATRGLRADESRPRPLEFDENGFPVPQRASAVTKRVARLLGSF